MLAVEIMSYLTETERQTVRMKADGLTYRELAQKFGITENGISSRFYRMRLWLIIKGEINYVENV